MNDANRLLSWYKRHGRDLPWRKTRNPYRILVSEIMLQQTQVSRVLDFYRAWLRKFPTWGALADASNAEVIRAWSGLGYNRRALMLRNIAREIRVNRKPQTASEWIKLKGIGPYTANAVACFAFHERVFPIDTNTRRVTGRLLLGKPFPAPKDDEKISKLAARLLQQATNFYDVPQAMFDLANRFCAKVPDCKNCPMRSRCKAAPKFLKGTVRIPKRMAPKPAERIRESKRYPDRIYRGRILKLAHVHASGTPIENIGPRIDETFDEKQDRGWLEGMLARLQKDGLIRLSRNRVTLPKD